MTLPETILVYATDLRKDTDTIEVNDVSSEWRDCPQFNMMNTRREVSHADAHRAKAKITPIPEVNVANSPAIECEVLQDPIDINLISSGLPIDIYGCIEDEPCAIDGER